MTNSIVDQWQANWKALTEADLAAKTAGTLVGRYISHPYADGNAIYKITKVSGTRASIEVVTGLGDDWVLPAWGKKTTISLTKAAQFVSQREAGERIFASRR